MVYHLHDYGYKKLFSNVTIFRQLLETFVHQPWIKDIDFDTAETIDHSFISDEYKETESDLIYKAKLKDQEILIYILLEFQSTVDPFIAIRILNYMTSLYLTLIKSGQIEDKLPPIFPIMLYNGDDQWTAAESVAETIAHHDLLGEYGIGFKYLKIAENEYSAEKLLKIRNIVSTLFLAENHYDLDKLQETILDLFEKEDRHAISLFLNWFRMLAVDGRINASNYKAFERIYLDQKEVKQMLVTAISEKDKRLIEKGKIEGKIENTIEIVKKMLLKGISISDIVELTDLTEKEIEKFRKGE